MGIAPHTRKGKNQRWGRRQGGPGQTGNCGRILKCGGMEFEKKRKQQHVGEGKEIENMPHGRMSHQITAGPGPKRSRQTVLSKGVIKKPQKGFKGPHWKKK